MVNIEAKIIIGLIAVSIMNLVVGVPARMIEKKIEKNNGKIASMAVIAMIYLIFYIWIIWYWLDLLGEVID